MKCFKHYDAKKKFCAVLSFLFQATGLDCLQSHHSGLSMYDKEKFHRQRNSDKNWLFICTVAAEIWKILCDFLGLDKGFKFWMIFPDPTSAKDLEMINFLAFLWNISFSISYWYSMFIGPRSDHSLRMSVTNSLTNLLKLNATTLLKI